MFNGVFALQFWAVQLGCLLIVDIIDISALRNIDS